MQSHHVLIVDDEELVVDGLTLLLASDAIAPRGATSRAEAVACLDAAKFPVVVADIRLRTEEEGLALLDDLRELAPDARVICMSGYVTPELEADVLRRGAHLVLRKPFATEALRLAILEVLAELEELAAAEPQLTVEQLHAAARNLMHWIPIRRYGLSPDDAEDVVQEAWLLFLERRERIRFAFGWLAGTVANLCRRRFERRREELDDGVLARVADERCPDPATALAVHAALARLDPRLRELAVMLGLEGYSYEEASEATGYARGAIGPLYIRAKTKLRETLEH